MERKKGGWGGRGFGVLLMKGGKGVSRGHVNLKSPPSVSDRCEIQVDMVDFPPLRALRLLHETREPGPGPKDHNHPYNVQGQGARGGARGGYLQRRKSSI